MIPGSVVGLLLCFRLICQIDCFIASTDPANGIAIRDVFSRCVETHHSHPPPTSVAHGRGPCCGRRWSATPTASSATR